MLCNSSTCSCPVNCLSPVRIIRCATPAHVHITLIFTFVQLHYLFILLCRVPHIFIFGLAPAPTCICVHSRAYSHAVPLRHIYTYRYSLCHFGTHSYCCVFPVSIQVSCHLSTHSCVENSGTYAYVVQMLQMLTCFAPRHIFILFETRRIFKPCAIRCIFVFFATLAPIHMSRGV